MSKLAQDVQRMVDQVYDKKGVTVVAATPPQYRFDRFVVRQLIKRTPVRSSPKTKARRKSEAEVIAVVRSEVFALDPQCICGKCKPSPRDEMNEVLARSKTRRMAPEERFNVKICVRMSRKCHAMFHGELGHGKRLKVEFLDDAGAMGRILMTWKDGRMVQYCRLPIPTWKQT